MIEDYKERLQKARENTRDSNCIGTALYLAGLTNKDGYYPTREVFDDYLVNLEEITDAKNGSLVAWIFSIDDKVIQVPHMGIITLERPPCLTHRAGRGDHIITNHSLIRLNMAYDGFCDFKFYDVPLIV